MRYTKKSDRKAGSGAGVILCTLLLGVGCQDDSREPEHAIDQPAFQTNHAVEPQDQEKVESSALASNQAPPKTVHPNALCRTFTDSFRYEYDAIDFDQLVQLLSEKERAVEASPGPNVRPDKVHFEMTLVLGETASQIKPYYLSTSEVTAEMFYPWATGYGLGTKEWVKWVELDLRPSRMLVDELRHGPPKRPALGMSRTVAEHYCAWLTRQTGRHYRLPTESEWEHAMKLGGGLPGDKQTLLAQVVLKENSVLMLEPPFLERPTEVGKKAANALGLYDMFGNAAEWVGGTGDAHVVRGGHYMLKAEDLTAAWRGVEDIDDWNSSSPWGPKPAHWYTSFPYTGIRLACNADQAPITPSEKPKPPVP